MFSHTLELSKLQSNGPISKLSVIGHLKTLCRRCKRAVNTDELYEVISDFELLETRCNDSNIRSQLHGYSETMMQRLIDYDSPQMQEFSFILSDSSGNALRTVLLVTLTNIASLLVMDGEIIDHHVHVAGIGNHQPHYCDVDMEMRLSIPDKQSIHQKMSSLRMEDFSYIWKLIQCELDFRKDSINPIRKLNIDQNVAPCVRWNLSQQEVDDDLHYLYNWVYKTNDHNVLEQRWEWGRKLWTLHAKYINDTEHDSQVIVVKGRLMEIAARKFLDELNLLF